MSDLEKRLREYAEVIYDDPACVKVMLEAADTLASVREERDRFAALAAEFEEVEPYLYQQAVNRLDRSDTDE